MNEKSKTESFDGLDTCFPPLLFPTFNDFGFSYNEKRKSYEFDKTLLDDLTTSIKEDFCSVMSCEEYKEMDNILPNKEKKSRSNKSKSKGESLSTRLFRKAYECNNKKRARKKKHFKQSLAE